MIVDGAEQLLERALLNLLDNALRFAPRESEIVARVARDGSRVSIDVIDHGPGIPTALQVALFDRFRRTVPDAAQRAHDGAGLGLAIAQALVHVHHGTLSLHASSAEGSTFRIGLPSAL